MELDRKIGVAVKGLVLYQGKALIIKRSDYEPFGAGQYECPGGRLEFGEELEKALQREIMEETGLIVTVERLLYATSFVKNAYRQVVVLTWLCKTQSDKVTLSSEHTEYIWAGKADLKALLAPCVEHDFERCGVYELEELK